MNQPLIWRFVVTTNPKGSLFPMKEDKEDLLKWELRYFWSDTDNIAINLIHDDLLILGRYKEKQRKDEYYLLPDSLLNIKQRKNQLLYKPVIRTTRHAIAFGKKIPLDDLPKDMDQNLASTLESLRHKVLAEADRIPVKKEAYVFKFPCTPTIKLELARLEVHNKTYYSACVEGRSLSLVETISKALFGTLEPSDYMHFLTAIRTR